MISTILTLVLALFSLVALMVIHEYGHFIIAKKFGVRVDEFGIGYPPKIWGKKIGETEYSINWIPFGAFVRIYGEEGGVDDLRSFQNLKIWKRVLIVIGGVAAFWIAAIIIFSVLFGIGADLPVGDQDVAGLTNAQVKIVSVSQNSPAGLAGIKIGDTVKDIIVGKIDTKVSKVAEFQKITSDNKGKQITLTIGRGNQDINVNLTPRVSPPAGEGSVGVGLERMATLIKKTVWYETPIQGVVYTWNTTINALAGLYSTFAGLFTHKGLPAGAAFAGPIGITVFLANAASYGAGFFLYFIGTIAVLVAIFNLFPIPALDGGKLIFLLLEKIKGKPVSVKWEQGITMVFFIILITLSLFITIRFDVPRLFEFIKSAFVK